MATEHVTGTASRGLHTATPTAATADLSKLFTSSELAQRYKDFRPTYPDTLYDAVFKFLGDEAPRDLAVDLATGSGQAAVPISDVFESVFALDVSAEQVKQAPPRPNITFKLGEAEDTGLPDGCTSLVTVAQALHWFDLERFYPEVHRILVPGGVLACWGYATCTLGTPGLDKVLDDFYNGLLGPYWSPRRRLVEAQYEGMQATNFSDVRRETFPMVKSMTLKTFVGYLSSWSAYQSYLEANPDDADVLKRVEGLFLEELGEGGSPDSVLDVNWPVFCWLYRK